jgi:hypothetical protein
MRKKYWPDCPVSHMIFRKGFAKGSTIAKLCEEYDIMKTPATVFYINPNELDNELALHKIPLLAGKKGVEAYRDPGIVVDAYKVTSAALNQSFVQTWADIDVDTFDQQVVDKIRSVLNKGFIQIKTHGGYHFMVHLASNPKRNWAGDIRSMRHEYKNQLEIEPRYHRDHSFYVPMPYTLQGGKMVEVVDCTL